MPKFDFKKSDVDIVNHHNNLTPKQVYIIGYHERIFCIKTT